ncbi:DUF1036 domain-containing protein [Breoghania sp. L-A4]|nr:DUF1036 domain-containing protein [Breoghania sp. L-A4]
MRPTCLSLCALTRPLQRTTAFACSIIPATIFLTFLFASPASAELRLCNKTDSQVGIAVGYRSKVEWSTEGWWNLPANSCETLIPGQLASRFYYIYAIDYDQGGEWGGRAFMCTREKEFTIAGIADCVARGYERTGFFEIDTGEQRSWTVQLTEPVQQGTGGR